MTSASRPRAAAFGTGLLIAAATAAFAPPAARADTAAACWGPGAAPALFDWTTTPALACRDGAAAAATGSVPVAASGLTTTTAAAAQTSDARSATDFTFSGSAYVGVAVAF